LENDIIQARDSKKYKGQNIVSAWYRYFKPRMVELVGLGAKNLQMQRSDYYDTAYLYLFNLLVK